ncbi:MAG TPA: hypothetical protein VIB39_18320 [Candidatus Angelobacter sp.]|jgi:hypothetical protein
MMNEWQQFVWLCERAAQFILFPPVLICATVFGIIAACASFKQRPLETQLWRRSYWLVFTQLLFYPAIIGMAVRGPSQQASPLASLFSNILFLTSLGLAMFWIWRMKGLRLLAISLVGLQQLLLLGALLMAGMAISGDWL